MKFLLLLFLLINSCADNKKNKSSYSEVLYIDANDTLQYAIIQSNDDEDLTNSPTNFTEAEKDNFIQGMKKGDYSVLLPFITRDDISPYRWILNGNAVVKEYKSWLNIPRETIPFSFKQVGKVIGYTNRYKAEFINDQEILWDLEEIKSLPNAVCFGFYDMMQKAFETEDPQKIINLYKDYSNNIMRYFSSSLISIVYKRLQLYEDRYEGLSVKFSEEEKNKIVEYLFPIIYPTKEQQRIFLLNLPLYRIGTRYNIHATEECRSKNTITTPYNKNILDSPYLRENQEYECLLKE